MKHFLIGLLLTRNEEDVIKEVIDEYAKQVDTIFCIDGSEDKTLEIIKECPKVEYAISERELGIDGSLLKDGMRQLLLSRIQDKYGYDGWILPIQGDEIFHGNLQNIVNYAYIEGANVINCIPAYFVIHESEKESIGGENPEERIQHRRRFYFLGQAENCCFKNQRGLYYNLFEHMRTIPHGFYPQKTCSKYIIRKHYNMRDTEQFQKRIKDRVFRKWQPSYANLIKNAFISSPEQIITPGLIYSAIQKFDDKDFYFSDRYKYMQGDLIG